MPQQQVKKEPPSVGIRSIQNKDDDLDFDVFTEGNKEYSDLKSTGNHIPPTNKVIQRNNVSTFVNIFKICSCSSYK